MRKRAVLSGVVLLAIGCVAFFATAARSIRFVVGDFQDSQVGRFPRGWRPYKSKGYKIMRVLQEGKNRFLRVASVDDGVYVGRPIYCDEKGYKLYFKDGDNREDGFSLFKYPYLSWRWRVHILPKGGNERSSSSNDSGAAVAVVFKNRLLGAFSLKYVWSASLPVGTIIPSPGFMGSYTRIFVLRSGKKGLKKWHYVKRNIYKDYIKAFGEKPDRNSRGIAFLTDSDDTESKAMADYDDVVLYRAK